MRAFIQGLSPSIRRRKAHLSCWPAALAAAVLLATLIAGTATAATDAMPASSDPTVVSDWNRIAVTTLAGRHHEAGSRNHPVHGVRPGGRL
jgi:heme A synthase